MEILILYYSRHGATQKLARQIARGIEKVEGCQATLRTVNELHVMTMPQNVSSEIAHHDSPEDPIVTLEDIKTCSGLALGSPVRFGNMAAPLKHFIDSTSASWLAGHLEGKPACVFTSSTSLHGGQETTLQSMMLPLLHHGMMILGLPYSAPALHDTTTGGTPYGPTHVDAVSAALSQDEVQLAQLMGERLATTAVKLECGQRL